MTTKDLIEALSTMPPDTEVLVYDPSEDIILGSPSIMLMVEAKMTSPLSSFTTAHSLWWSREEIADMSDLEVVRDVVALRINEEQNELHL